MGTKNVSRRLAQKKSGELPDRADMISAAYCGSQATSQTNQTNKWFLLLIYYSKQILKTYREKLTHFVKTQNMYVRFYFM